MNDPLPKEPTTVRVSKKELSRLLQLARFRKRNVEHRVNGMVENIYIDNELFAEAVDMRFYNIVIMM